VAIDEYLGEGVAEYVREFFPANWDGVFIDVGAYDPFWRSNSYIYEEENWNVYCIEPNSSCIPKLKKHRKNVLEYACSEENRDDVEFFVYNTADVGPNGGNSQGSYTGLEIHSDINIEDFAVEKISVSVKTLDWLMENEINQDHIDILSIDVEGHEMSVLRGTNLKLWKPKFIIIENILEDPEQYAYLESNGYSFIKRFIYNDVYMLEEYITEGIAEFALSLFPEEFKGVCVDVGAYDPLWISNSHIFELAGWDTYCIEPNPACIPKLKRYRKNVIECACSDENIEEGILFLFKADGGGPTGSNQNGAGSGLIDHRLGVSGDFHINIFDGEVKVRVRTLDWLMENEIHQSKIDFLSIDVERNEMSVLRGTDLDRWSPKVICIENLDSEQDIPDYLLERGYTFVDRITCNDFYIRNEEN